MDVPEINNSVEESTTASKPSRLARFWPSITNEEEAEKAARSGGYAAAIVAVLTSSIAFLAIGMKESILGMDGWGLVDAFLFAVIAWRVFKLSFPWAVFGLVFYCAEMYWKWSNGGFRGGNVVLPVLIILWLIAGVRGTAFLSKRGNLNGVLVPIIVAAFAAAFSMYIYQSTHTDRNNKEFLDTFHATEVKEDFAALNKDYEAKNWDEFRGELLSREHYLIDLKVQDRYVQLHTDGRDKCGRMREYAMQDFITAQEKLMSFAKNNTIFTDSVASSVQSLAGDCDSAAQQWNRYNIKDCADSK